MSHSYFMSHIVDYDRLYSGLLKYYSKIICACIFWAYCLWFCLKLTNWTWFAEVLIWEIFLCFFRSISSFEWWNILNVFYIWNIYWNCNMDLEPWHVIHQIYGPPRRRRKFKTLGSFSFGIVETYFPYTVTWLVKQEKLCRHHSSCVAGMAVQRYPTFFETSAAFVFRMVVGLYGRLQYFSTGVCWHL